MANGKNGRLKAEATAGVTRRRGGAKEDKGERQRRPHAEDAENGKGERGEATADGDGGLTRRREEKRGQTATATGE